MQQHVARVLLMNACFDGTVMQCGNFYRPQSHIPPCFKDVFPQTALKMGKPCMQDVVLCAGLFCGDVHIISVRSLPSILLG